MELPEDRIAEDEIVIHVPNPFKDLVPQTQAGGSPPRIPSSRTIMVGESREEKSSMTHRVGTLGCLLLVVVSLALWLTTSCVAIVALLR